MVLIVSDAPDVVPTDGALDARWTRVLPEDAIDAITWLRPDLILLAVPDGTAAGAAVVAGLVSHPHADHTPIVAVTSGSKQDPGRLLDAGADDVIDLRTCPEWPARLRRALGRRQQLVELVRRNHELDELASIDVLTELPNRRSLDEQIRLIEATCLRRGEPLGVLIIDIDNFKGINDSHGHAAGDEVLRWVAHRLRTEVRASDAIGRPDASTIGRWAGDEFIVGTSGSPADDVAAMAERLVRATSGPVTIDTGREVLVSVSIGGSVGAGEPWPELLRHADGALYEAKAAGRGTARVLRADSLTDA